VIESSALEKLRLRTLGGAGLWRGESPLEGAAVQRRRVALLALLGASGAGGVPRDKVVGLLWPESEEERARHSLSQMLFLLRRDCAAEDLVIGTADLRLNPERISSDVEEFEEALRHGDVERAVELYGGAFLDGFHLAGGSVEFDRWAEGQRDRLARAFAGALEKVAAAAARKGEMRRAADLWLRLAAADPYDARVAIATVRALDAAGDRAGALAHARVHSSLLREELGSEPSPQLLGTVEEIRASPITAPTPRLERPEATETTATSGEFRAGRSSPAAGWQASDPPEAFESQHPTIARPRWGWRRRAAAAALLLLIVSVSAFELMPGQMRANALVILTRGPAALSARRIVVAPLENQTGDENLLTLGEWVADWMAQELMRTEEFEVVDARTSVGTARVVDAIPRILRDGNRAIALAEETGAGILVSGRYYREGDTIVVHVQMTDVGSRKLRRTFGPFRGSADAPSALARIVADRVVAAAVSEVDGSVAAPAVARALPPSYEAYRHARRAWEAYYGGDNDGFFTHAAQAAATDTTYMAPIAMQAHVRSEMRDWGRVDSLAAILESHQHTLAPLEAAVLQLARAQLSGDLRGQLAAAQAVVEATPASPETRTYVARVAVNLNRPEVALAALEGLDPRRGVLLAWPWFWNWKTAALHLRGEHREELRVARQGLRQFPNHRGTRLAMLNVGRALAALGMGDELRRLATRLPADSVGYARAKIILDWSRELRAHDAPEAAGDLLALVLRALSDLDGSSAVNGWALRAAAELEAGRLEDARRSADLLLARDSSSIAGRGLHGLVAAKRGDRGRAEGYLQSLAGVEPFSAGRNTMWRARISAVLGDREQALSLVRQALAQGHARFYDPGGGPYDEPDLHIDPAFASLRPDPRFRSLLGSGELPR
jgi:DNA-binding SARP family transcriptional activator/TolB-like protein/tetratricopeptide (TPR) repeat protein